MKIKTLLLCLLLCIGITSWGQEKKYTNKYGMKLTQNEDGSFKLNQKKKYEKIIDLTKVADLLTPYEYKPEKISKESYKKTKTTTVTYKTYPGYSLQIDIDMAKSETPVPVMFYIHGGGWSKGNNKSHAHLSKYLAQQHNITGVRIMYTLAPQENANIEVTIQDVLDAVQYIKDHAKEYNIDANRIGFCGASAGAHLSACGALMTNAKVLVGYSGVYDLTTAEILKRTKSKERINYFKGLDPKVLEAASPVKLINKKTKLAAQLYCGTADLIVEYSQSLDFAAALKKKKGCVVDLQVYENYEHSLQGRTCDKMEEIFFKSVDFITENL